MSLQSRNHSIFRSVSDRSIDICTTTSKSIAKPFEEFIAMSSPVIELQSGSIRGVVEKHEEGFDYYAFKGIPYAEPPVGELRFKDPIPIKKWSEVRDCRDYGPMCLQYDYFSKNISHDEDCLYLNVFSRTIDGKSPVMVLIHGGAFTNCSSDDFYYGPEYLIRKNLVFVTFNYRLGVLGFLDLEDEIAPGNQGLKDQLMALQWVQTNIRSFGGDPDNVTLLGISAGGVAAHLLSLSPLSKDLFHRVIAQGAVIQTPWRRVSTPRAKAADLCTMLGKRATEPQEILDFLRTVEPKALQEAQERLRLTVHQDSLHFGPGTDAKSPNPVMPIDPDTAADQGVQLPILTGYNDREGIILLLGVSRPDFFRGCDANFGAIFMHGSRELLRRYDLTEEQVRRAYYKSEVVSMDNLETFVDFATHIYFAEAVHRFARVQADRGSAATYLYVYSYDAPDSISKTILEHAPRGAGHLDELPFVFKMRVLERVGIDYVKKGTRSHKIMEQITEMWANFATYGRPTIKETELIPVHWLPINDGTLLRYMNLDEDICMQSMINLDQKFAAIRDIKV